MGYTSQHAQNELGKLGGPGKSKTKTSTVSRDSQGRKTGTKTKTVSRDGGYLKKTKKTTYSPDSTTMKKTVVEKSAGGSVQKRKTKEKLRKPKATVSFGELKTKQKGFKNQGGKTKPVKKGYGTNKSVQ